jgi:TRAP-type C4-dicarboxylate transport system permease small subunit
MSKLLRYLERVVAPTTRVLSGIGAVAIMVMMLLIVVDVLFRSLFNLPIKGAHEIIELMVIMAVFLAIAYVQHQKSNISVDILTNRLPQKVQAITGRFISIFILVIIGVMVWQGFGYLRRMLETGKETTVLHLPTAIFEFVLVVGLFVLCIVLILDLFHPVSKEADE